MSASGKSTATALTQTKIGRRETTWLKRVHTSGRDETGFTAGTPVGQKTVLPSSCSSAGASVSEASSATARLMAMAGPPIRDLYMTEVEVFSSPVWVIVYVICMVLIGLHLRHGISSAFQSIGVNHPIYTKRLVAAGIVLAILIGGGFAIIPIYVYFTR